MITTDRSVLDRQSINELDSPIPAAAWLTTPRVYGRIELSREAFLGSDEEYSRALEIEIKGLRDDLKRERKNALRVV